MRIEREHHPGFSSNLYIQIGWLNITWSRYENHWYLAVMWARPLPPNPGSSKE